MLSELSQFQEDDEQVQRVEMSFTVTTRDEEDGELIDKKYTFSFADGWDEWWFKEYEEVRTPDTDLVMQRNWKQSRHVWWDSPEEADVDIPQCVSNELAEKMGVEEVNIKL